jgi:hypothetical protein
MQADIEEMIIVKFEGELARLLAKVEQELNSKSVVQEMAKTSCMWNSRKHCTARCSLENCEENTRKEK